MVGLLKGSSAGSDRTSFSIERISPLSLVLCPWVLGGKWTVTAAREEEERTI
jgi:hypothetical protein